MAEIGGEQGVWLVDAVDGQRRRVSCGLLPRHAAAFLEAHEMAFDSFGGVFRLLRFDDLKSAVKKIECPALGINNSCMLVSCR